MQLTPAHTKRLRDEIRANQLEVSEIRKVTGAGEQYIALDSAAVDKDMYTKMYGLSIDGVPYTIYAKINKVTPATQVA